MDQNESLLHELDDRLSIVKRWGIVRTIHTQSVAEHCFNVQRICMKLAPHFGVVDMDQMFMLSQAALHHDDNEAVYGDIPSPAKAFVKADENGVDVRSTAWYDDADIELKVIVKLADLLEAYHFITMEFNMGNYYTRHHRSGLRNTIVRFIQKPDCPNSVEDICLKWLAAVDTEGSKVHP